MIAAFFLHILLEAPIMNLILCRQIAEKEMKEKSDKMLLYYLEQQDAIIERS